MLKQVTVLKRIQFFKILFLSHFYTQPQDKESYGSNWASQVPQESNYFKGRTTPNPAPVSKINTTTNNLLIHEWIKTELWQILKYFIETNIFEIILKSSLILLVLTSK